jgi:predicted kinase
MSLQPEPVLIVVTGLPGTGKTTIANDLSAKLAYPSFRKDEFKEILFDVLGWSDKDWSEALDGACYELLWRTCEAELRAGRSCLIESNFEREAHAGRIRELGEKYGATAIEVHCRTERHVLAERFKERVEQGERHPGHAEQSEDVLQNEAIPKLLHEPDPWLGVTETRLAVDTTDTEAIDTKAITAWVRRAMAGSVTPEPATTPS